MPFSAQVIRVLIASPSDVDDDRDVAVQVIQKWNDLHSAERQVVILPVRWETHSVPEYGLRPQGALNRQIVDNCDMVIGVFWTRLGTDTGEAASGTIEEIERVAAANGDVMLYFSQVKQDPALIDVQQLQKLREFKERIRLTALVESYRTLGEFQDKLSRQLDIKIREWMVAFNPQGGAYAPPHTVIEFEFADPMTGKSLGKTLARKHKYLNFTGFETLPDFEGARGKVQAPDVSVANPFVGLGSLTTVNSDYYREFVSFVFAKSFFTPVRFFLKNIGGIGARDVFVQLEFRSESEPFVLVNWSDIPKDEPKELRQRWSSPYTTSPSSYVGAADTVWTWEIELSALQPQRALSPEAEIAIGIGRSGKISVSAEIYADTLRVPVVNQLQVEIEVEQIAIEVDDIVAALRERAAREQTSLNQTSIFSAVPTQATNNVGPQGSER